MPIHIPDWQIAVAVAAILAPIQFALYGLLIWAHGRDYAWVHDLAHCGCTHEEEEE